MDKTVYEIREIRELFAKQTGKKFEILKLFGSDGSMGDITNFEPGAFNVGDKVNLLVQPNYRYQYAVIVKKL